MTLSATRRACLEPAEPLEEYLHRMAVRDMAAQPLEVAALVPLLNDFARTYTTLPFGSQALDTAAIRAQVAVLRRAAEQITAAP